MKRGERERESTEDSVKDGSMSMFTCFFFIEGETRWI